MNGSQVRRQIFIVDDHPLVREVLRSRLEREPDLVVADEAGTAEEALEKLGVRVPDLVLIDVSLPGMSGIELARILRTRHPELRYAMLSGHGERSNVEQALRAGARGYIMKGRGAELPGAIRKLLAGERYLSAELHGLDWDTDTNP